MLAEMGKKLSDEDVNQLLQAAAPSRWFWRSYSTDSRPDWGIILTPWSKTQTQFRESAEAPAPAEAAAAIAAKVDAEEERLLVGGQSKKSDQDDPPLTSKIP